MNTKTHWEQVYTTKAVEAVSWFQPQAQRSIALIAQTQVTPSAAVIDVGSGASRLIDGLVNLGFHNLTALDVSSAALAATQKRLGEKAAGVTFKVADITHADLPHHAFDVWHDRAVFHFLTEPEQRRAYVEAVLQALKPGGHLIVATFAEDGPEQCSGLPVQRYSPHALQAEFGAAFEWLSSERETHTTPFGTEQRFVYSRGRKVISNA